MLRRVIILGSTGSIGLQTVEAVAHLNALHDQLQHPHHYRIVGLAAGHGADAIFRQAVALGVCDVSTLSDLDAPSALRVRRGPAGAIELVESVEADIVVAAVVGSAGLPATLAAATLGRRIALANKETLVAAGELVVPQAARSGSVVLPVDSEHSGVWQCLSGLSPASIVPPLARAPHGVKRVVLTASGGPFRAAELSIMRTATPEQALRHPTWTMGAKVTIDSASLMNKALEIIEARWLFGLSPAQLGGVIHPQSVVHALVELDSGSTIAQLGQPDMRTPILHALAWPEIPDGIVGHQDFARAGRLDFEPIDPDRFPAFGLAFEVLARGGNSGAVLNAANESAVKAFLQGRCLFGDLAGLASKTMQSVGVSPLRDLRDVMEAESEARHCVAALLDSSHRP